MPVAAAVAALLLLRSPLDAGGRARFLLFAFSAACASRVLLGVAYGARTTPYAILAVPGLAAAAAVLVVDHPAAATRDAREPFAALLAVAFLGFAVVAVARWRRLLPPEGAVAVQTGAGSLRLPPDRARVAEEVLAYLAANARAEDTLSGIPEAGFFNFVTGLRNPLRQEQILPGHLDAAREARVVDRIAREGPRYFLLVNQAAPAFGPSFPGRDYAVGILEAVAGALPAGGVLRRNVGRHSVRAIALFHPDLRAALVADGGLDRFPTADSTLVPIAFARRYR